jgi:hypothetical protein
MRLLKFLPKKLSPSPQKYGFRIRDPGSEIRDPRSGIRKNLFRIQGSKRHRIPDPDPQHCQYGSRALKALKKMTDEQELQFTYP